LHLDSHTDNQEEEVQRLLELGTTRHARTSEPGEDFIVLEDPEGDLFCVVTPESSGASFLSRQCRQAGF